MTPTLPTQARVVVVGGGIAGVSTAYHLAKLLEARGQLANLLSYMDGKSGAEDLLAKVMKDPALMQALQRHFLQVFPVEALGWIGDALEAQAFAFLAMRSLNKLAISLPSTTGTLKAVTGGALYRA